MDEQRQEFKSPRRRRRTQAEIFKEVYLPAIIAAVAVLLILIYIIGTISRTIKTNKAAFRDSVQASIDAEERIVNWIHEEYALLAEAECLAAECDYDGALAVLRSFSGDISQYKLLSDKIVAYEKAKSELILWNDPNAVINLSFQILIADPSRAYTNAEYGTSYNKNYITTQEFSMVLQQLYDNGYMLINMDDIVAEETDETGEVTYAAKPLYLPKGKKPLMITQAQVNYYTYIVDSDGDNLPDKDGAGFASKLILDENGEFTCQMVDKDGNTVTGDYDLVPILEKFIESHPDFSYRGARATLSISGYDGVFGYRTNPSAKDYLDEMQYEAEIQGAQQIADALRQRGYDIACYTYRNRPYGQIDANDVRADISNWNSEVVPILGEMDTIVLAQNSDITEEAVYSGEKYEILRDAGFRYFIGFADNGNYWTTITPEYVRMGRLLVCGSNMAHNPDWFNGLFDATSILDPTRGDVPQ